MITTVVVMIYFYSTIIPGTKGQMLLLPSCPRMPRILDLITLLRNKSSISYQKWMFPLQKINTWLFWRLVRCRRGWPCPSHMILILLTFTFTPPLSRICGFSPLSLFPWKFWGFSTFRPSSCYLITGVLSGPLRLFIIWRLLLRYESFLLLHHQTDERKLGSLKWSTKEGLFYISL